MMSYAQFITKSFRLMKTKIIPLLFNPECAACNKKRFFFKFYCIIQNMNLKNKVCTNTKTMFHNRINKKNMQSFFSYYTYNMLI